MAVAPFLASYGNFATQRTPVLQPLRVDEWASHFGVVLVIAVGYLVWQFWSVCGYARESGAVGWPGAAACFGLGIIAIELAFVLDNLALLALLLVLLAGFLVWYRHDDARHLAIIGTITIALVLCMAANRMVFINWTPQENIPMQFSLVAWVLLAVIAGPVVVGALAVAAEQVPAWRMGGRRALALAWTVVLVILVAASAVYPVLGLPQRAEDRLVQTSPTLDSFAFMEDGQLALNPSNSPVGPYDLSADLAAIEWMRENLQGRPTILETPAMVGGWGGRISALTGFPAVLGSVPVQNQQRPGMERLVAWRSTDIATVYSSIGMSRRSSRSSRITVCR